MGYPLGYPYLGVLASSGIIFAIWPGGSILGGRGWFWHGTVRIRRGYRGCPYGGPSPGSAHDGRPIMSEGTIRDPGGGTPRRPVSEGIGWWRGVPGGSIFGLKMQENCKVAMKLGPFWGVCTVFWGFSHKFR